MTPGSASSPAPLIVGNWKMHGLARDLREARALAKALMARPSRATVALCPPATLLPLMSAALKGGPVATGGQTCHAQDHGAFTGEISAAMLADAGASYVILGHSERRTGFGETDAAVAEKALAAVGAGLTPILCVGETRAERRAGRTFAVLEEQVRGSTPAGLGGYPAAVAYEPVWAVGGDRTPAADEIEAAHAAIRASLVGRLGDDGARPPILYGGSVTAANAAAILALREVGGLLVGRACLEWRSFLAIVRAADPVREGLPSPA